LAMPDEPFPVRRKIDLEWRDDWREHAADAFAWRQNLGIRHGCICSGRRTGCNCLADDIGHQTSDIKRRTCYVARDNTDQKSK
jgi:hypothetical protein